MDGDTRESRRVLPAQPSSVPDARRTIRAWLTEAGFHDLVDEAEQAVSEVVTNALVHAGTTVELSARMDAGYVRVEVVDGSSHLPRTRDFDTVSGTGRGLKLLAQSVTRWGSELREDGKVVWFELGGRPEGEVAAPDTSDLAAPRLDDEIRVELLAVPLLLMSAWLEHAGALLRDCLLLDLEVPGGDVSDVLQRHAVASELLALLEDQLPRLELGTAPDELMAGATEPLVTADRVELLIPPHLVERFPVLDAALDRARQLATTGALLTPPTQPEMQELRHWVTGEVARQTAGGTARPWLTAMSSRSFLDTEQLPWDESAVAEATTPLVAIDDYDVIVAVSRPALDLLGYERGGLVGRRVLGIIPSRYRQAHLAGFTLHQINGRSPLLGSPVTVPVLCADGTERTVQLTITAQPLSGGRTVFLGALEPVR
ncbi:MAG TPA: PAS domain S-box protein [Nocardioides sp.]|uniref:PAS domain S-box protein n=1 Tax=uncultured Nocardioides sp. TaxID=198441 RepID=UPI00262A51A1|nr:PAS domain S-box protein [uncultured Nocardioides sp.]HRD62548.1 PAS domain S-box protein [Nocardioides sp.]HRI97935.1 PAS domain S-box protein [Nocardioides sp.]HRK46245.1 PAS domain S-box protein [Nocardioides sp.]